MAVPFVPEDARQLEEAVAQGVLVEGTSCDFKAKLDPGPKANTKLAIDLAAFSVEGGMIVIGVAEEGEPKRLMSRPMALAGLRERISQVGTSRVDPAVTLVTRELPSDADGNGYLLILVPASPLAPHQVDGSYRGRSDTTNTVLTDAAVRTIQAERRRARPDIAEALERAVQRDPTPPELRAEAHLFVVARPAVAANPAMLQERLGTEWRDWIDKNLVRQPSWGSFSPDLPNNISRVVRRPDGWAAVSSDFSATRVLEQNAGEDGILELEVDEDGSLRLFCSRGSHTRALGPSRPASRWTFEELLAGLTWRVVRAAGLVADKTAYFGNWEFGVAMTNMRGATSWKIHSRLWSATLQYADDDYRAVTVATFAEVTDGRDAVVARLVGRLNRALNDGTLPLPTFDNP